MTDQKLYGFFTNAQWRRLTVEERLAAAQEVENRQAALSGRAPIPVSIDRTLDKNVLGGYSSIDRTIGLRAEYFRGHILPSPQFSPAALLDTLLHEGRHAYQHALVENPAAENLASDLFQTWKINFSPFAYIPGGIMYFQQAIERDARMFALHEMRRIAVMIEPDLQFYAQLARAEAEEHRYILDALTVFPSIEALDAFEQIFLEEIEEMSIEGLGIDPRTFHFFTETRIILELHHMGNMSVPDIFRALQENFFSNDYDLSEKLYDRLIQEHPEQFVELQTRKLQMLERNRKWKAFLDGRKPLESLCEPLEKPVQKPAYRIRVA